MSLQMVKSPVLLILAIASLIVVQCGGPPPATEAPLPTKAPPTEAPATAAPAATEVPTTLDGKSLLEARCTVCHDLGRVMRARKTEAEWKVTVSRMVGKGAKLTQAEQEQVIQYLAEAYPK